LLIDKPAGPTSHDVVDAIRREFRLKKVGHCGTLDPNATGLLIIVLGRGTKLSEKLMSSDKVYEGTIQFGTTTNSYDVDGEILETKPVPPLTLDQLNNLATQYVGDQMQIPPMVSAIKKEGVPLYKLAREGKVVEREPRFVHVYAHEVKEIRPQEIDFRVICSKGFYVRTYAHEIGKELGCGAHLAALRRTKSGRFTVEGSLTIAELKSSPKESITGQIISLPDVSRMRGA